MSQSLSSLRLLVLSLIATVLLASVGLGLVFDSLFRNLSERTDQEDYQLEKSVLTSLEQSYLLSQDKPAFLTNWHNAQYTVAALPLAQFPLPPSLQQDLLRGEILVLESEESISLHKWVSGSDELLSLHLQPAKADANEFLRYWLTSLFYLCLLGLVLLWLYPLLMRLLTLRQAAKEFGEGKFATRVKVGSISYIADIEREFNRMALRIEHLIDDIRLLSSAVSHDLRTPLARIRFGVETMAEEDEPQQREYFQQRIVNDVDAMVELVEQMLDYSRLERQLLQAENEEIDLVKLLPQLTQQAQTGQLIINMQLPGKPAKLAANQQFISMLFNNVLGNAIKFAKSTINIQLHQQGDSTLLCIEDDGPGIPINKRAEMLKPFIRDNDSSGEKGYGLGLAVVKRICEFYAGTIVISDSQKLGGASVQLQFLLNHAHNS